jgi:phenylalanyl-tRNA synthetase alpha chain
VTLDEFVSAVSALDKRASETIAAASNAADLEALRTSLLGRKAGELVAIMKLLPSLPPDDRRQAGAAINTVKSSIEELLTARVATLAPARDSSPSIDLTMPARETWKGGRHPVTVVIDVI